MDTSKLDVDALFKQYTIKEIQAIELQIKNEIEKKKEDLRIMVYNRYRDIIDAADGIHVMKNCSKQIENVLNDLQTVSDRIFNDKDNSLFADQDDRKLKALEKSKRNNKYVLAVITKILQNTPTKIWYHLDNNEYLKAAKQYLIAQNAHICIDIEKNLKSQENFASYTQYANELWNSILLLSSTIVSKARSTLLHSKNASSAVLIDSISCIYLLENTSLKDLFKEYISTRNQIICSMIDHGRAIDLGASIKDRVVDCLKTFVHTVYNLFDLFSSDLENKTESCETIISDQSFTIESLKDDGIVISKIPTYLRKVKFKDIDGIKKFDQEFLKYSCSDWLKNCLNELKESIESILKYAINLKNLALVKDAVRSFETGLLNNNSTGTSSNNKFQHLNWTYICESLFNQNIELWSQLVSPFYHSQSKLIIETSFKSTHENFFKNLKEAMSSNIFQKQNQNDQKILPEIDLNSFLWSFDVFNQTNEMPNGSNANTNQKKLIEFFPTINLNKSLGNRSLSSAKIQNIILKQYSTTPTIQKLSKLFEEDLSKLLNDIEFGSIDSNDTPNVSSNEDIMKNAHLKENLQLFSDNFYNSLFELLQNLKQNVHENDLNMKEILFICRLVHALPYTCPILKACFYNVISQPNASKTEGSLFLSRNKQKSSSSDLKNPADEMWCKFLEKLSNLNKTGFRIWIQYLCEEISRTHLADSQTNEANFAIFSDELISWDEIEIEEELNVDQNEDTTSSLSKSTNKFKSKLSVPLVCSSSIQNMLYWLSQQLTKNLTYTMIDSNLILKELMLSVLDLVLKFYLDLFNKNKNAIHKAGDQRIKLTQNQSLQILFDLKFLFNLFDFKSISLSMNSPLLSTSMSFSGSSNQIDHEASLKLYNKLNEEFKNVTDLYESLIDPFDYDICLPFMQSNIAKSITRSSGLYGILSINEKQFKSSSALTSSTTANEKFNLIQLSNVQHRFELLPISANQQQNQQQMQQNQQNDQISYKSQLNTLKMEDMSKKSTATSSNSSSGLFGFKWF